MKKAIGCIVWFVLIFSTVAAAQNRITDLSVDQLFEKARYYAFEETDYDSALSYAYKALDRSPDYYDIGIFVARIHSWQGNFSRAEEQLGYVLEKDPQNRGALLALIDIKQWADNYKSALQVVRRALNYYPTDIDFLMLKADLLREEGRYDQAAQTYKVILAEFPDTSEARKGLKNVRRNLMKNQATVSYRYDHFRQDFDPWHFTGMQLMRQTDIGSFGGAVEYARRFGSDGVQFSLDGYPEFAKGFYGHLNIGYSDASIYPKYQLGTMLYKSMPDDFEISAGFRYLDYDVTQTDIYILGLTKYLGSYMLMARTFLVPNSDETSASMNALFRRYFSSSNTYLGVNAGFGSAPVEVEETARVRIQALDTWSVGVDGQFPLSDILFTRANIGFDSSDYPNFTREQLRAKVSISYRF